MGGGSNSQEPFADPTDFRDRCRCQLRQPIHVIEIVGRGWKPSTTLSPDPPPRESLNWDARLPGDRRVNRTLETPIPGPSPHRADHVASGARPGERTVPNDTFDAFFRIVMAFTIRSSCKTRRRGLGVLGPSTSPLCCTPSPVCCDDGSSSIAPNLPQNVYSVNPDAFRRIARHLRFSKHLFRQFRRVTCPYPRNSTMPSRHWSASERNSG